MKTPSSLIVLVAIAMALAPEAHGQSRRLRLPAGAVPEGVTLPPELEAKLREAQGKPDGEKSDKDKEKDKGKPGEKNEKEKKDDAPKPLQRPTTPPKPADKTELNVRPDKTGHVKFNFTGQAWPDVLQWLADISGMSLDWQELPADYLNLTTLRSYTVDEVRDLLNRHLLARGFTLLRQGEVLSVVNLKKLDPALVPRVAPAELDRRDLHEFVRVSFPLEWLMADLAVEELKPMLSPFGKATPLVATNRVEVLDAVVNLRGVRAMLVEEQSTDSQERLIREFPLHNARATEVLEQLQTLLGIEPKGTGGAKRGPGDSSDQMQQQMQQRMQEMMQQAQQGGSGGPGGPGGKPPATAAKPKAEIHLVANRQHNSILAQAPADKMAIIDQAIKILDVSTVHDTSLAGSVTRTQIYRLAAIDPEPLVKTLEEIGNLDPQTRLQVDRPNKAIIAYGPLADQVTIRALVEKLDGTGRKFEVRQLRRLPADYVAGTVAFMMTGAGKEKPKQRRPYWDSGPTVSEPQEKPNEFRCDADLERNRLLLWANDVEIAEVDKLLTKLGEIPPEAGSTSTVRAIEAPAGKETDDWLRRIEKVWPSVAPNRLVLPPPEPPAEKPGHPPAVKPKSEPPEGSPPAATRNRAAALPPGSPGQPTDSAIWLVAAADPATAAPLPSESPLSPGGAQPAPPIKITRSPDGRLLISCPDPKVLDQLEDLMGQIEPPGRVDYEIFRLHYAWATGIAALLRDVFKEDDKDKRRSNPFFWDWDYPEQSEPKSPVRLSHRRPLKILSDNDTNSVLVQGADPAQLRKIRELIEFYDKPEPTDARSVRKTQTVSLKFGKAKAVAEAVKDVYRDLLSANDKALQSNKKGPERQVTYIFDTSSDTGADQKTPTFKGLLSIGVDEVSNCLLISAPAFLFEDVAKLIDELDQAAKPSFTKVEVVKLGLGSSPTQVQEALGRVFGNGQPKTPKPAKPKPPAATKPGSEHQHHGQAGGSPGAN